MRPDLGDVTQNPVPDTETAGRALVFRMGGRDYAIGISQLSGMHEEQAIRRIHAAPVSILGLTEVRGTLLMVVDLSVLLGCGKLNEPGCFLRLAAPHQNTALYLPSQVRMVPASEAGDLHWIDAPRLLRNMVSPAAEPATETGGA